MAEDLERRCGTCARFVRVVETIDATGEVKRKGECLLGVWPSPLYETNTCSQWVRRGDFKARPAAVPLRSRGPSPALPRRERAATGGETTTIREPVTLALPEDLLEMD